MKQPLFCGIDTSNYTTSVALTDESGSALLNFKKLLPVKEGERGLRQSDAVFHHVKQLAEGASALGDIVKQLSADHAVAAIGVSATPRDAEGSYMPCFLSGLSAAETAGAMLRVPVYRLSHQNGHIMAALHSAGRMEWIGREFIAFHVSGGTTEVLHVQPCEDKVFTVSQIGGTRDINAGQAIDRAGVYMGLQFPAGAEMERLASSYEGEVPEAKISVVGMECNLSGVENKAIQLYDSRVDRALVSAFVLCFVGRTLAGMRDGVRAVYGDVPILYAGGVMSCGIIKEMLAEENAAFAKPQFSSDNAFGTALLARHLFLHDKMRNTEGV